MNDIPKISDFDSIQNWVDNWKDTWSPWEKFWSEIQFECEMMWHALHSNEYRKDIWLLKHLFLFRIFGYKPIMIGTYFGEDTFVFKTQEEANRAFEFFERGSAIPVDGIEDDNKLPPYKGWMCGWWYGIDDLKDELKRENEKNDDVGNLMVTPDESYFSSPTIVGVSFDFHKIWEKRNER